MTTPTPIVDPSNNSTTSAVTTRTQVHDPLTIPVHVGMNTVEVTSPVISDTA